MCAKQISSTSSGQERVVWVSVWRHITGLPDEPGDCGLYSTKAEAASDRAGLLRFYRRENDLDFWTTDPCRQTETQIQTTFF